jgi:S1-C subfamily serine protease
MNRTTPGNFSGVGSPPRRLTVGFPLIGDLWIDTSTNNNYIYSYQLNGIKNWTLIPGVPNFNNITNTYAKVKDAMVTVTALTIGPANLGSGFFISADGYVVTTAITLIDKFAAVVNDLTALASSVYIKIYPEYQLIPVVIKGINRKANLALLKADLTGRSFLPFTDSRAITRGSIAMTIGQFNTATTTPTVDRYVTLRVVEDNKWQSQTQYRESVLVDNKINNLMWGGPTIDLNGNVIGVSAWNSDIVTNPANLTNPNYDSVYAIKGSIASKLAMPITTAYLNSPTGATGVVFPAGFFGIAYDYYTIEANVYDNALSDNMGINTIDGIQIVADVINTMFNIITVNTITNNNPNGIQTVNPVPLSPAAGLVPPLELLDIIIAANVSGQTLLPIGNSNNHYPFDTIVYLAGATGMIDIQYLKASDMPPWSIVHTATGIALTSVPNDFDNPLNRFT